MIATGSLDASKKDEYLAENEIEELREAQEPAERIKLLDEFLNLRLERVRALKTPGRTKDKSTETKPPTKRSSTNSEKVEKAQAKTKKSAETLPEKNFTDLMNEYQQCLEEVSSNIENFSSFHVEPKAYLKSLSKLDESLSDHVHWLTEIEGKLDKSERELVNDISESIHELSQDVKTSLDKANEQIRLLKEAKKAKAARN
jgi:hypothetical protein